MTVGRLDSLSLSQLKTFQMVLRSGGYTAASRQSDLSVPAVWQQIQSLERAYGVPLFIRRGRQVVPTEAAHRLAEHVDAILVNLESTFDVVAGGDHQAIRLVTGVRMLLEDMTAPLAAFHRRHPNKLVLRQGNGARAEQLLLADEADIGMTLEPAIQQQSSGIHYEPAYTVEFLSVARRSHPYTKAAKGGLRELARHDLIVTAAGAHGRDALDQALHREGLTANIVAETDNSAFTLACVSAGMGVGILAGRPQGELARKLVSRSLSRQLGQRRIVFMWRKGRVLSDPMVDFVESVIELNQASRGS